MLSIPLNLDLPAKVNKDTSSTLFQKFKHFPAISVSVLGRHQDQSGQSRFCDNGQHVVQQLQILRGFAINVQLLLSAISNCRVEKFPEIDSFVMVNVRQVRIAQDLPSCIALGLRD